MAGKRLRVRLARAAMPRARAVGVLTGLLAALIAGCGTAATVSHNSAAPLASEPAGTISETGSTLLYPIAKTWAAAYHQHDPGVTVTTAGTGSGKGISAASAGTVDIGASDAFLSSGDLVKNPALVNIPLVVSAQTVIYNLPSLGAGVHVHLDGTVLAGMYDGTITTWDNPAILKLNPGVPMPATKVVPVHRFDSSGDTFLFTSYLSTQDPLHWGNTIGYGTSVAWPPVAAAVRETGSTAMLSGCYATPGCVAYNGISYLSGALSDGLGEAELANSVGQFTLPTAASVQAAIGSFVSLTPANETISMINGPSPAGYPIVNYEYAIVSTKQPSAVKASEIKAFLRWVLTTGNESMYLSTVGFQPLPSEVVTLGEQQIAEIAG